MNAHDDFPQPTEPLHEPIGEFPGFNLRTLGVVILIVAAAAALSAIFPMGWQP